MPDELISEDTEGLAQFNRLLPEARALDKTAVKAFRTDPVIALQNVTDGVRAVIEVGEPRLAAELPTLGSHAASPHECDSSPASKSGPAEERSGVIRAAFTTG